MRPLLAILVLALSATAISAPTADRPTAPREATVSVMLARTSGRTQVVPWQPGLTVDDAIASAAPSVAPKWKEAWRQRETFWTRNFRNPHSFWARLLAGERATGFAYFPKAEADRRQARLKPGDRIYVDLPPIQ